MLVPKFFTVLREGYGPSLFRQDLFAGMTVAIVALPLAMAIAIASGTTPDKGLFTAVVAGFLISLFGGSRHQIGGPTAAFVIVVYAVIQKHGYDGMILATLMAGGMLIVAGLFRLGTLIKFIPHPVITGFTAGIAVVIFSTQIKDFFGLTMAEMPAEFVEKWIAYGRSANSWNAAALTMAVLTLALIIALRKWRPSWPGLLIAVSASTALTYFLHLPIETIGSRFGGIPSTLPVPVLPSFTLARAAEVLPSAITIALLAGIESLLSCVIADTMTGRRHRSNIELIGQGIGNIGSALFGGLPATGALARTATNIKAGAQTPASGMLHAVFLLAFMWLLAPLAGLIPLAALAAVLMIVAWNMSEIDRIRHLARAPDGDRLVLIVTFLLTVLVDITVAIEVGIVLASLVFMRRMVYSGEVSRVSSRELAESAETDSSATSLAALHIPKGVEVFQIDGPFFFGVASRLAEILDRIEAHPKVFILRMGNMPFIDASGAEALNSFIANCRSRGTRVLLTRLNSQPHDVLQRLGLLEQLGPDGLQKNLSRALLKAEEILAQG